MTSENTSTSKSAVINVAKKMLTAVIQSEDRGEQTNDFEAKVLKKETKEKTLGFGSGPMKIESGKCFS